jgi:hypothetical protein
MHRYQQGRRNPSLVKIQKPLLQVFKHIKIISGVARVEKVMIKLSYGFNYLYPYPEKILKFSRKTTNGIIIVVKLKNLTVLQDH